MAAPGTQRWLPPVVGLSTFVVILLGVEIFIRIGLINRFIRWCWPTLFFSCCSVAAR
jgi:hypothetical protein